MSRSRQWRPDETQTTVGYICLLEDNGDPMNTPTKSSFNDNIITAYTLCLADYMSMRGNRKKQKCLPWTSQKNYHKKRKVPKNLKFTKKGPRKNAKKIMSKKANEPIITSVPREFEPLWYTAYYGFIDLLYVVFFAFFLGPF